MQELIWEFVILVFQDNDNAIKEMEKALEINPTHQIGHLNLGVVNLNAGNIEDC